MATLRQDLNPEILAAPARGVAIDRSASLARYGLLGPSGPAGGVFLPPARAVGFP